MTVSSGSSTASLAILPFEHHPENTEIEYFSRGIVEELILDFSRFPTLQVISSYTSGRLSESDVDVIEAANRIHIDYLLTGTMHQRNGFIRLNIQLILVKTGEVVWAKRFEAPKDSVFELQDGIVEQVSAMTSSEIDHQRLATARDKPLTSLPVYDCWLRGMDQLRAGTLEADRKAREYFNTALSMDPHYARAYAGLSLSHFNEWSCQLWELYQESEQNAYEYAIKAFKLDDGDYLVHMILGRVYLYRREFDQAEYHVEKSLELNGNEADNLVQLASCLAFLGRTAKAERLFKKALRLNPYRNLWYYQYGSFIYFVQRKFAVSIEMALKRQLTNIWVDLPGYIAAAHAHLGDMNSARKYLALFINAFITSISKGRTPQPLEVIDWVKRANPFKHVEDTECIVQGLHLAGLGDILSQKPEPEFYAEHQKQLSTSCVFKKENVLWRIEFNGVEITMPDLKGLRDIASLLLNPETQMHCTELMGAQSCMAEDDTVFDRKAQKAYGKHINELKLEIEEAENNNDIGKAGKLHEELEQVLEHLANNTGIGGKSRSLKSPTERARAAVTLRIRSAVKKITQCHPALGKHLSNSLRTGVFCGYFPESPMDWQVG